MNEYNGEFPWKWATVFGGISLVCIGRIYYYFRQKRLQSIRSSQGKIAQCQVKNVRQQLNFPSNGVHIALVGRERSGKTTLARLLAHQDDKDVQRSDLQQPTYYAEAEKGHSVAKSSKKIFFWDTPSLDEVPIDFAGAHLYAFDGLLLLITERLMESDIDIAIKAHQHCVPTFFVRTFCDWTINDKILLKNESSLFAIKSEVRQEFQDVLAKSLAVRGMKNVPTYCVSRKGFHDFIAIKEGVKKDFSLDEEQLTKDIGRFAEAL